MTPNEKDELFWMIACTAAILAKEPNPSEIADRVVLDFQSSEVLSPPVPPEKWDDEDVPF